LQRVKKHEGLIPPVELRELLAKEVAIAAARGHMDDEEYLEMVLDLDAKETLSARDQIYKTVVQKLFVPRVRKFRGVIEKRDDDSGVEQTRAFWQPKETLLGQVDRLLSLCQLGRTVQPEEKAEWIYELYMAARFYPEMETTPGAAWDHIYWTQGKEYVPEGYMSGDEKLWVAWDEYNHQATAAVEEAKEDMRKKMEKKGMVGVS
jgi:hypothetical protein